MKSRIIAFKLYLKAAIQLFLENELGCTGNWRICLKAGDLASLYRDYVIN
jgi:hypothetical protein